MLKLTLKPGERFHVGTAEIQVVVDTVVNVIVEGTAPVLRAEDHVAEVEATTPGQRLRHLIQQMYLTGDIAALHRAYFEEAQTLCAGKQSVAADAAPLNLQLGQS